MSESRPTQSAGQLIHSHPRRFAENCYVYPVLSRRSGGISIGVNLNPDKRCNFNCAYCQVDRRRSGGTVAVDVGRLAAELDATVELVLSGRIYRETPFCQTPLAMRHLRDIAFSGDGEPTTCPSFDQAVAAAVEMRRRRRLDDVKLVLITNASMLDREPVQRALEKLDANNGEIWAKLDAGTDGYFRRVARSAVPFRRILENLCHAAAVRPIVIQSLFMRLEGQPPPAGEQEAYCQRLIQISSGGTIKVVQLYTVARPPAESWVSPLGPAELDALAERVRRRTGLTVATYH
ncbi:MAG TPA: radical SAM protein [Planctomycetaceae bacterium]|nr:radical SAM protein [Planctomycetaceae bacterium]HIQ20449.1 radical SAM protein [Planctomycetota bacterium]